MGAGAVYFVQHFASNGVAPPRRSGAGQFEAFAGLSAEIAHGYYATLDVAGQMYVLRMLEAKTREDSLRAAFTGRASLGLGKRF